MRFSTIHNTLDNQLKFEINYCGIAKHGSDWLEQHSKPTYAVWIIDKGNINITYNGHLYQLQKGDAFIFRPNVEYTAWNEYKENCSFMFIQFEVYIGKGFTSTDVLQTEGMLKAEHIEHEAKIIFQCYKNYIDDQHLALLHLKSAALLLITKMLTRARTGSIIISKEKTEKINKLKTVLTYIDDNLDGEITIKELADLLFMSEKYFITYFKKTIGVTPYSYILSIKMKKAYEYIEVQGYTVKQTAALLGYTDQYTFSKAFKRFYGFSPSRVHATTNR